MNVKNLHKIFIFFILMFVSQMAFCCDFNTLNSLNKDVPNLCNLNFSYGFEPGKTLEEDFQQKYPFLISEKDANLDYDSVYEIDKEYLNPLSDYNKVVLIFQNGLLNTLSLYPKDLELAKIVKLYGNYSKIRPATGVYKFYEYSNFILLVNSRDKKVKSIGIISSI